MSVELWTENKSPAWRLALNAGPKAVVAEGGICRGGTARAIELGRPKFES